jgi:polyisoprenoid-binding protein YceI
MASTLNPTEKLRAQRRRHKWRWIILGGTSAVLVIVVVASVLWFALQSSPTPFALPHGGARSAIGGLDVTWTPSSGSLPGFRVHAIFLGMHRDLVGRTEATTGELAVSKNPVNTATLRIDLRTVLVDGKTQPKFAQSLDTADHPVATITLTEPISLDRNFMAGAIVTTSVSGDLSLHGVTHPVTFSVTTRRSGSQVEVSGSIPVQFSEWAIKGPANYGLVGSLADHGVAEFLLVLTSS